jgi:S-formylglutathione hydrolase FrmB
MMIRKFDWRPGEMWRALGLALLLGALACNGAAEVPVRIPRGQLERTVGGVAVTLYTPPQNVRVRGNVLVLPGWKFRRHRWLNETPLKQLADARGLRLICPEMDRSIYASRYFPETRLKWNAKPGLAWLLEDLLPYLDSQGVFRAGQNNFLLGLSTGGRGVAQLALARPDLITAAAALSGDFDQTLQTGDRLMTAVYGPYLQFRERWEQVDNPGRQVSSAPGWRAPLYLAHGRADRVVPLAQSARFYERLRERHPGLEVVLVTPDAGHDFAFWSAQTGPSIDFFEKYMRTQ